MRLPALFFLAVILLNGCSSSGSEKPIDLNTVDSATLMPESNAPLNTEDHNQPGEADIALDSSIGPHSLNDTLKSTH